MSQLKTRPNKVDPISFLEQLDDEQKRKDCFKIMSWMEEITGSAPVMWGNSIIGFGLYHYVYKSGREGDWFLAGFSPRKQNITIYVMSGLQRSQEILNDLGKYKTGKSCLYIKNLQDIDGKLLRELITTSVEYLRKKDEG